jgi:hypothetical protein
VTEEQDDGQLHLDPSKTTDGGNDKQPFRRCGTLQGTSQL